MNELARIGQLANGRACTRALERANHSRREKFENFLFTSQFVLLYWGKKNGNNFIGNYLISQSSILLSSLLTSCCSLQRSWLKISNCFHVLLVNQSINCIFFLNSWLCHVLLVFFSIKLFLVGKAVIQHTFSKHSVYLSKPSLSLNSVHLFGIPLAYL